MANQTDNQINGTSGVTGNQQPTNPVGSLGISDPVTAGIGAAGEVVTALINAGFDYGKAKQMAQAGIKIAQVQQVAQLASQGWSVTQIIAYNNQLLTQGLSNRYGNASSFFRTNPFQNNTMLWVALGTGAAIVFLVLVKSFTR